jgi:hypothetical protein
MPTLERLDRTFREPLAGEVFVAGERVPPGVYHQIDTDSEIVLDSEDYLPASLDGRVACYEPVHVHWFPSDSRTPRPKR